MTADTDIARARTLVSDLRGVLVRLHATFGASVDVRRLEDDVARLAADLDLLAATVPGSGPPPDEIVYISDEEYSPGFWADSDDEGLGAPGRR